MLGYKPQIALLVPIALAAAGLWRVFGAACLTIIGLSLTATLAFGPAVWPAWISMLPAYARWFDTVRRLLKFKPTVIAKFDVAGVALPIAEGIQAVVAVVWRASCGVVFVGAQDDSRPPLCWSEPSWRHLMHLYTTCP